MINLQNPNGLFQYTHPLLPYPSKAGVFEAQKFDSVQFGTTPTKFKNPEIISILNRLQNDFHITDTSVNSDLLNTDQEAILKKIRSAKNHTSFNDKEARVKAEVGFLKAVKMEGWPGTNEKGPWGGLGKISYNNGQNHKWSLRSNVHHASDRNNCAEMRVLDDTADLVAETEKNAWLEEITIISRLNNANGTVKFPSPCNECLDLFHEYIRKPNPLEQLIHPETKIIGIQIQPDKDKTFHIVEKTAAEFLPTATKKPFTSSSIKAIEDLKIEHSENARKFVEQLSLKAADIGGGDFELITKALTKIAKGGYEHAVKYRTSERDKPSGAAVLLKRPNNGFIMQPGFSLVPTSTRLRKGPAYFALWSTMNPVTNNYHKVNWVNNLEDEINLSAPQLTSEPTPSKKPADGFKMVVYWSEKDNRLPRIFELMDLQRLSGEDDFLVGVVEDDKIKINTLSDYIPYMYLKSTHGKNDWNT